MAHFGYAPPPDVHYPCHDVDCSSPARYCFHGQEVPVSCEQHRMEGMLLLAHHPPPSQQQVLHALPVQLPSNPPLDGHVGAGSSSTAASLPSAPSSSSIQPGACHHVGCNKQPRFGFEGSRASACLQHRANGMVLKTGKGCETPNCHRSACYGLDGNKATACAVHSSFGMIDLKNKRCEAPDCIRHRIYSMPGGRPRYCSHHMELGMVNVVTRRCSVGGCNRIPTHAAEDNKNHRVCSEHKVEGMSNVSVHRRCDAHQCSRNPIFGFEGYRATRCAAHKEAGMEDVKHARCGNENCDKVAAYAFQGEKPRFCCEHKQAGMLSMKHRRCVERTCVRQPVYGFLGGKAEMCSLHKKVGMQNVLDRRCFAVGCDKLPTFGHKDERASACARHKKLGMENVRSRRCEMQGCSKQSRFGMMGEKPRVCENHRQEGMAELRPTHQASKRLKLAASAALSASSGLSSTASAAAFPSSGVPQAAFANGTSLILPPTEIPSAAMAAVAMPPMLAAMRQQPVSLEQTPIPSTSIPTTTMQPTDIQPTDIHPTDIHPTAIQPSTFMQSTAMLTALHPTATQPTIMQSMAVPPTAVPPTDVRPTVMTRAAMPPTTISPSVMLSRATSAAEAPHATSPQTSDLSTVAAQADLNPAPNNSGTVTQQAPLVPTTVGTMLTSTHAEEATAGSRTSLPLVWTTKSGRQTCALHKQDGMVEISASDLCRFARCVGEARYGFSDEEARFCSSHKRDGMSDRIVENDCQTPGCGRLAVHQLDACSSRRACCVHQAEGTAVDDPPVGRHRRCVWNSCLQHPLYAWSGEDTPRFCGTHMSPGMLQPSTGRRPCRYTGCSAQASFAFLGEACRCCADHRLDGMLPSVDRQCHHDGCNGLALYWDTPNRYAAGDSDAYRIGQTTQETSVPTHGEVAGVGILSSRQASLALPDPFFDGGSDHNGVVVTNASVQHRDGAEYVSRVEAPSVSGSLFGGASLPRETQEGSGEVSARLEVPVASSSEGGPRVDLDLNQHHQHDEQQQQDQQQHHDQLDQGQQLGEGMEQHSGSPVDLALNNFHHNHHHHHHHQQQEQEQGQGQLLPFDVRQSDGDSSPQGDVHPSPLQALPPPQPRPQQDEVDIIAA